MRKMEKYIKELKDLKELSEKLTSLIKKADRNNSGTVRFSKRKSGYQYYIYHSDGRRTYVKKSELDIIKNMAQQEYYRDLKEAVTRQISALEQFLADYNLEAINKVYENRSHAKQILIEPLIQPDAEFIQQWYQQNPGNQNPFPEKGKYITDKGEYVRSKSEKILADMFYKHNVPYQYEPALKLKSGRTVYPDFVLLNTKERKTYYWEHLGLAAEDDYASKNLEKINMYEKNGVVAGENLLISMETEFSSLDIKQIEQKIKEKLV